MGDDASDFSQPLRVSDWPVALLPRPAALESQDPGAFLSCQTALLYASEISSVACRALEKSRNTPRTVGTKKPYKAC